MGRLTLDIIVTHYKEPWETGRKLFDSIAMQECIDFDDVSVILVNDGEGHELPKGCFVGYPYDICQMSIPKGGVGKARNAGLDASNADWVMFCDFDDCFSSIFGLNLIFCAMHENKYDTVWSCFTEEIKEDGQYRLVAHDRDWVFIHGKVHRRQYLVDKEIRFHPKLTIHEDVFFNMMAQSLTQPERVGGIKTPFYCWRWNDESVVRKDRSEDYVFDTYDHLMRQRMAITEEFLRRKMMEEAMVAVVKTVVDTYYDCQQANWLKPENREKLHKAQNWFAAYLKRYANYYINADVKTVAGMMRSCRENALKKGTFLIESITLKDWLQHIVDKAKPVPKWEQDI